MAREYTADERRQWLESLPAIPAGAAMLLEDERGRLLVVKASYRSYWTPPGGVVDEGETPKEAAIRETKEEVGLWFTADKVEFCGVAFRKNAPFRNTFRFIFTAPLAPEQIQSITLRESEIEAFSFVSKEEVLKKGKLYSADIVKWASDAIIFYDEY